MLFLHDISLTIQIDPRGDGDWLDCVSLPDIGLPSGWAKNAHLGLTAATGQLSGRLGVDFARICVFQCLGVWGYEWSDCVSACLFVCQCFCLFVCLSVSVSLCPSVCQCVYLSVCLLVFLSVCLSLCLSVCQPVCISVCHCLSISHLRLALTLTPTSSHPY